MNRRSVAALSLAVLLPFSSTGPALATEHESPATDVAQEDGKSWFSVTFDITGQEESFLAHVAAWFQKEPEPEPEEPARAPVGIPVGKDHAPGQNKDRPGHHHGHDKDHGWKWWKDKKDKHPEPDPTDEPTDEPTDDPTTPEPTDPPEPVELSPEVQAILDGHNEHREENDLPALTHSPSMSAVAQDWAESMAENGEMVHNPDYAEQLPPGWESVAENIAMNSETGVAAAERMVEQWITSPDHEANITGDFTHVGIGFATLNGESYGTVNFGAYAESPDPEPTPEPTDPADPTTPPADGETTGGSGGEFTNDEATFTSAGQTSTYRLYGEGRTGNPGLLFWTDGTGGFGYENPDSDYLIGGDEGMEAIARERNMILVVPLAPGSNNVWYDGQAEEKAQWSADLMTEIKSLYDIDLDRIVIGGYSSGAQWTTRYFLPPHGEEQSVDLAVAVGGGGTPLSTAEFTDGYKAATVIVHNTGTADTEDGYNAYADAQRGEEWYRTNGFVTDPEWPAGVTHDRGEEFGGIVAEEIDQHLG